MVEKHGYEFGGLAVPNSQNIPRLMPLIINNLHSYIYEAVR